MKKRKRKFREKWKGFGWRRDMDRCTGSSHVAERKRGERWRWSCGVGAKTKETVADMGDRVARGGCTVGRPWLGGRSEIVFKNFRQMERPVRLTVECGILVRSTARLLLCISPCLAIGNYVVWYQILNIHSFLNNCVFLNISNFLSFFFFMEFIYFNIWDCKLLAVIMSTSLYIIFFTFFFSKENLGFH